VTTSNCPGSIKPARCIIDQFSSRRSRLAAVAFVHAWLCACSGSGAGLDSNGQPLSGSSSGGAVPLSADFDSIQANVFTPICSVCHIGATAPQGLMLDAAHSYDLLVGVPSTEVPSVLRVKPGDPTNSYIIQKLEGHAAVGGQMPLGETPLPATTIAFIAQWITDGAPAGTSATAMAMATGFRVASVTPENEDVLAVAPAQIVIGFTRELDATRADAAAVRLERIDGAGETASTTAVAIEPSVPAANPRALLLAPRTPLTSGQYRIVLSGQTGAALSSLDGELMTAAPTEANGDRIISRFTVAATP
jgi:hypothetical protein